MKLSAISNQSLECGSLLPLFALSLLETLPEASFRRTKAAARRGGPHSKLPSGQGRDRVLADG
jgi:hypothetical protein